jgi:hypothetical protein
MTFFSFSASGSEGSVLSKILSIWSEAGISGKVMQVVGLPPSTTGQVQMVGQETKNCTWKISGRCWKVRHRHMPLWGGAMMRKFTTMAAAGEAFTSLDKIAVGDDSGLKSFIWPDRKVSGHVCRFLCSQMFSSSSLLTNVAAFDVIVRCLLYLKV